MKTRLLYCLIAFFSLLDKEAAANDFGGEHFLSIAPEIQFMVRTRGEDNRQTGLLYGMRLNYDRFMPWSLYWGGEAFVAWGSLDGKNGFGDHLHSHKRDSDVEARLGYTMQFHACCAPFYFSPFVVGGYFEGTNRYVAPSPLELRFCNYFPYMGLGFLSRTYTTETFSIGLNFKTKFTIGAKSLITDDPDFDDQLLIIEDKVLYELDIPFNFRYCCWGHPFEFSLTAFYRYRHYGEHSNFPFDFVDTRFQVWGGRASFTVIF